MSAYDDSFMPIKAFISHNLKNVYAGEREFMKSEFSTEYVRADQYRAALSNIAELERQLAMKLETADDLARQVQSLTIALKRCRSHVARTSKVKSK